jgi:Arc/MetJ-type ribon-helix-helix transcriptional regulator
MSEEKNKQDTDMEIKDVEILNVRLPEEIVKWLDSLVQANIYGSRSEAVRDFIRDYVRKNRK